MQVDDKLMETLIFLLPVSEVGKLEEYLRKMSSVVSNWQKQFREVEM